MEDTATAEISRAQLWQWIRHAARTEEGAPITGALYKRIRDEELDRLKASAASCYQQAADILDQLTLTEQFTEFLTFIAYPFLT